jgi:glycolate oxidase iron-sulfur subunit
MEDPEGLKEEIGRCMACRMCFDVCPIYAASQDEKDSPMYRLLTIRRILDGEAPDAEMRRILEECTLCGDCDATCGDEIPITDAIREMRAELQSRDA